MEFNLAAMHETVEQAAPDRCCISFRGKEFSYAEIGERTRRLANYLIGEGFKVHAERNQLAGHESGQDHLALYLHNGNEYIEGMIGAYKARVAPFNVNYRYVEEELLYLLNDSNAKGVIFHSAFAPTLDAVRSELPNLTTFLQVKDDSGNGLLPGAVWYEEALENSSPEISDELRQAWSPDDLYMLYTGGTTGMPKGVLWSQADIWVAALGGRRSDTREEFADYDELKEVAANGGAKLMPTPPFMHGAAHWLAFNAFAGGNIVVLPDTVDRFDPADTMKKVQSEGVNVLLIVGDAFARPLLDELRSNEWDTSSILALVSGGAALSAGVKDKLLETIPQMVIMDGLGASETGSQAGQTSAAGQKATTGDFTPNPGSCVLNADMTEVLEDGSEDMGWLAQKGRVPLGYLGDPEKTQRTFPKIDGVRFAVPGDRARVLSDGTLDIYGRDSMTINSGGEKIFAEEVEGALAAHPDVFDVVVCGRPSERWGNEVVAIVRLREGVAADTDSLQAEAEKHLARYKLPKAYIFRDEIQRSPSGKADYRWAKAEAVK